MTQDNRARAEAVTEGPERLLRDYQLPTFSGVVTSALNRVRDPGADADEVAVVLEADPGLTVRLLGLANSSAYGLAARVNSAAHAIALLGREQVEALLMSAAVVGVLPASRFAELDVSRFWYASARRATMAKAFAQRVGDAREASEAFTGALLQDMAVPLIAQAEPDRYAALLTRWRRDHEDLAALERDAFGYDHAELAARMCQQWQFAGAVTAAIGGHHGATDGAKSPVQAVSALTDAPQGYGEEQVAAHAIEQLGMTPADAAELIKSSEAAAEELARLFG